MKGYRFYEELYDKNCKGEKSQGNVIAVFLEQDGKGWNPKFYRSGCVNSVVDCLSATFFHPNSDVSVGAVSRYYLSASCRRISEEKARAIHPALFIRLDMEE